ncbi:MAG TPA: hypothetical protein VFP50_04090 [Anaeromyxobacteraceae bacterium]|nr:hypothetical protein [Anaeromyxobacteraceae bacterium]
MTGTADRLAARAEELPPGSMRRKVMEGARRFKAAWVDFARLLAEVRRGELWREWGHPSFEKYCTAELFIKKATADKLTASFGFLERHEPRLAEGRGGEAAPPFEVIEVLSRAEAAGRLSADGWRELRDEVLERPPTPAAMNKTISEKFGPPPPPPRPSKEERLMRLAAAARRLAEACAGDGAVPRSLSGRAEELAEELERLAGRA